MRVKKCRYAGPTSRVKSDFYDRLCGEEEIEGIEIGTDKCENKE